MFRRKNYKSRVETAAFPTELWLIIFDIVIEEGIISLDQCDYKTFPHMGEPYFHSARPYQLYDSYWRLRLVCQRFNTLLSPLPWQIFSDSSLLPLPTSTKALSLTATNGSKMHVQRLLAETSTCSRLVSLNVEYDLSVSHFLQASAGGAFPNVQRLALIGTTPHSYLPEASFWILLHSAFPLLVTLVLVTNDWFVKEELGVEKGSEVISFERLEILYIHCRVTFRGCHFPRLLHASIAECSAPKLETLISSPYLQSLLIQSTYEPNVKIDVTSCSRLKLLGFSDSQPIGLVPLARDHPLEHIWLYCSGNGANPDLFEHLSPLLPKISRITLEFISYSPEYRSWRIAQLRETRLDSFGLIMGELTQRPSARPILVIERPDTGVTQGCIEEDMEKDASVASR